LNNKATRAAKGMKKSDIEDCDCERLQDNFTAMGTDCQEHHERAYDGYRIGIEETIKTDKEFFIGYFASRLSIGQEF
jgi:hypothetical protein